VWDAETGAPICGPFTRHHGAVHAVAVKQLKGRTIVVSGSNDGAVWVWDAATGTPIGDPFTGHYGAVNAVEVGQLNDRIIVISGSDDGTVLVRDTASSAAVGQPSWARITSDELLGRIDLAAPAFGLAYIQPCRLVIATELGIVSLRLPMLP
jgi:WD40 repeat protein